MVHSDLLYRQTQLSPPKEPKASTAAMESLQILPVFTTLVLTFACHPPVALLLSPHQAPLEPRNHTSSQLGPLWLLKCKTPAQTHMADPHCHGVSPSSYAHTCCQSDTCHQPPLPAHIQEETATIGEQADSQSLHSYL